MGGIASALYGGLVYLVFLATFLYTMAFVGNLPVPKTIDSGEPGPIVAALVIDTLLLGLFAVQHSVMARPAFKRWWTRLVPSAVERTTYVLFASMALLLLYWQWRPIPDPGLCRQSIAVGLGRLEPNQPHSSPNSPTSCREG